MPARKEMPSTLKRSSKKAQQTWAKKVGDHWEPKDEKGPSDERAAKQRPRGRGQTAGGVDANATKEHLMRVAKRLDVPGRSRMTKAQLVDAIQKANNRESRRSRN